MSSAPQAGRSTATISIAQTAPIRIHHLTESFCASEQGLRWLPEAVRDALALCAQPSADATLFEQTLARDPALAAQVIAIAGAGLFAPKAKILSVREAVVHLGLDLFRDALLLIVTNGMSMRAPGFEAVGELLRRRALAAGIATRLCAKALRVAATHDFLVGLLHDIGEIVLLQRCVEEGVLQPEMMDDPVDGPVIRETIQEDHVRVGAVLCRLWKLPAAVSEAAELHHKYKAGRRSRLPAHLAAAGDVISAHVMEMPGATNPATDPVLTELSLPQPVITGIVAEVAAKLPLFASAGSTAQQPR